MKKILIVITMFFLMSVFASNVYATQVLPFVGLTGSGSDPINPALDGIPSSGLIDDDYAFGFDTTVNYNYRYDASSVLAENSPSIIIPNDSTGAGRWVELSLNALTGPTVSVDNSIPRNDGTTGKLLQGSAISVNDSGNIIPDASTQTIGDASNPFQDVYAETENGVLVTMRQLAGLQKDYSEGAAILPFSIACDVTAGVWTCTLTDTSGSGYLAFSLDDQVLRSAGSTLTANLTSYAGTDLVPNSVHLYVVNDGSGLPELVASNTDPATTSLIYSQVAVYKAGTVSTGSVTVYGKADSIIQMYKIASKLYNRTFRSGPLYLSGLLPVATPTDVTVGIGLYDIVFDQITTIEKQVSIDGLFYIDSAGGFHTSTDFSFGGEYSDGVTISDEKVFNVTLGVVENGTTKIMALVQSGTSEEYKDFNKAFEDKKNQAIYIPNDSVLKTLFVPVARIIVENDGGVYSLLAFDDGSYFADLRGNISSGGGFSSSSSVNDGNVASDILAWNATTGEYDPKTVVEVQTILDVNTLSGDEAVTGDKTYTGALDSSGATSNITGPIVFTPSATLPTAVDGKSFIYTGATGFLGNSISAFYDDTTPVYVVGSEELPILDGDYYGFDATTGKQVIKSAPSAGSFAFDTYPVYSDSAYNSGIARNDTTLAVYTGATNGWMTSTLASTLGLTPVTPTLTTWTEATTGILSTLVFSAPVTATDFSGLATVLPAHTLTYVSGDTTNTLTFSHNTIYSTATDNPTGSFNGPGATGLQAVTGGALLADFSGFTIDNQSTQTASYDPSTDPDAVALWNLEPSALTVDSNGGNTLTDVDTVVSDTVDFAQGTGSVVVNSTDEDKLTITDASLDADFPLKVGQSSDFSIAFWFKPQEERASDAAILGKYDVTGDVRSISIVQTADEKIKINLGHTSGTSFEAIATYATTMTVDGSIWYHIAFTYEVATKNWTLSIWDDTAQSELGTAMTGTATNIMSITSAPFSIGWPYSPRTNCKYDQVLITKDLLTTSEISALR